VEFGLVAGGQRLAGLLVFPHDVHSLGLTTTQGLTITSAWYWDRDDESRAFARRFMEKNRGVPPSYTQAGVYSAVAHYLTAIKAIGTDDPDRVSEEMRRTKINDFMTHDGWIREDGRIMRDMYIEQVKSPAESKYPWDYFKTIATIPANEAWRPLKDGGCPYIKGN
jgi:branched-chain amino acid transport system substrate-binding protein